jgi:hypothetical protein
VDGFVEMGWFGESCEMVNVFMFNVFLEALLSLWTCKQSLETYLGVGRSKFAIFGEKGLEPESFSAKLMNVHLSEH